MIEIPEGDSWRVSAEGVARHYKTKRGAENYCKKLVAEGKTPVIAAYQKTTGGTAK